MDRNEKTTPKTAQADSRHFQMDAVRSWSNTLLLVGCGFLLVFAFGAWAVVPTSNMGEHGSLRVITIACLIGATLAALISAATLLIQLRRSSKQRRLETVRLNMAIDNITQGVMVYDSYSRIVLFNRRYVEMYGLSLDAIQPGTLFRDVMKHRKETGSFVGNPDQFCDSVFANVRHGILTRRVLTTGDGRFIQIVNQPLSDGGWVTTHEDITNLKRSEQQIERLAHFDALTGLPNRLLFRETLCQLISELQPGQELALLYIDVDQFKEINDTLGHTIGDEFLKSFSSRLQNSIDESAFIARLGGDEFAMIIEMTSDELIVDLMDRIYSSMKVPMDCGGHQLVADASIGIALAPEHGVEIEQLVRNADLAMYEAKASGRRSYKVFQQEMDAKARAHRQMALDLREAIRTGTFDIHYQPIIDAASRDISCCEALLRWSHPSRGSISPAEFIPIAEDTGLIVPLGEWLLENACREAASWPDRVSIAVNVSPIQFRSQSFGLRVASALASSGLAPCRLELEITEAVLMSDDDKALETLHHLRSMGIRIALDDFGIGYSSLSYLRRFPFDKIKIDRSFIADLPDTDGAASIVQAVVTIANAREMVTTAEGVETWAQFEQLKSLGCTQVHGWLFSAAKPARALKAMFEQDKQSSTDLLPVQWTLG